MSENVQKPQAPNAIGTPGNEAEDAALRKLEKEENAAQGTAAVNAPRNTGSGSGDTAAGAGAAAAGAPAPGGDGAPAPEGGAGGAPAAGGEGAPAPGGGAGGGGGSPNTPPLDEPKVEEQK